MKKSDELKQERASKIAEQQKLVDGAVTEKGERRSLSEDETTQFDALQTDIEGLNESIKRSEAFEENQRMAAAASGTPIGAGEQKEKDEIKKRYSIHAAIRSQLPNYVLTGVEAEMHQELVKDGERSGVVFEGVAIPTFEKRADEQSVTGDAGAFGGALVPTDHRGVIDELRPKPILEKLGARFETGLVGKQEYAVNEGGIAATWEGELDTVGRTRNTYTKKTMDAHRLSADVAISLQQLHQSTINAESYTVKEINDAFTLALDAAGFNGSGVGNVPLGLLNDPGVNSVVGGTNGAAPSWAHIVDLETGVKVANVEAAKFAYAINFGTKGFLKKTPHVANNAGYLMNGNNEINGYAVGVSNLVPGDLDKGTLIGAANAGIFGDFSQLMIGQWGFYDMVVDNITQKKSGLIEITVNGFYDMLLKQSKAFSVIKDWDIS